MEPKINSYTSCFIGIPLPESLYQEFEIILQDIKRFDPSLIIQALDSLHITLYYLDKQAEFNIPKIQNIVENSMINFSNISILVGGLGIFTPYRPKVLYLTVDDRLELNEINKKLRKNLSTFSTNDNHHKYIPHMTIARVKDKQSFFRSRERIQSYLSTISWKVNLNVIAIYGVNSSIKLREEQHILKRITIKDH